MPSLKDLRNRINSVKSTQKITSAMKMVAASKLRRAQAQAEAARPFAERMERMLGALAASVADSPGAPRLLVGTGSDRVHLLIPVTADRGLAGAFNASIGRATRTLAYRLESEGKTVKIYAVGRKGRDYLRRELASRFSGDVSHAGKKRVEYSDAEEIAQRVTATLAAGDDFSYVRAQLGIDAMGAEEMVVPAPFDYAAQALLYLPPERLDPRDPRFAELAAPLVERLLIATRGRAFVLFTSNAVMRFVAAAVGPRLPFPYQVQGEAPKGFILDWFRGTANPVLFATATFWEGVDVVGDSLSSVVIDRIPFPPPDDPIVAARCKRLAEAGIDPFPAMMIPAAITRLKQGLGRLIRSASDRGPAIAASARDWGLICPAAQGGEAAWAGEVEVIAAPSLLAIVNNNSKAKTPRQSEATSTPSECRCPTSGSVAATDPRFKAFLRVTWRGPDIDDTPCATAMTRDHHCFLQSSLVFGQPVVSLS